jgi:hypothetical protein
MVLPVFTYLLAHLATKARKRHCRRMHASERMSKVTLPSNASSISTPDRVSDVLKWILLAVAIVSFVLFAWATVLTYDRAPPQPTIFVTKAGATIMTNDDIVAGKAGFQKADLMDYGSLYGMGSYFGQDYTAWTLIRLARLVEDDLAREQFGRDYASLPAVQQAAIRDAMRAQLQGVDLTQRQVTIPDALARAMTGLRDDIAKKLASADLETGWTPAYSLGPDDVLRTADFLIYSALTTVARRPAQPGRGLKTGRLNRRSVTRPLSTRFAGRGSASASLSSHLESFCSSTNFG